MEFNDFSYKGKLLSEYGCVPCYFNSGGGINVQQNVKLIFNTVKQNSTNKHLLYSKEYDNFLSMTFSICKSFCNGQEQYFSLDDVSEIMRWLNAREYNKFQPTDVQYDDIYFVGSFTSANLVKHGDNIIGFEVTFETNAPYAFSDRILKYDITATDNEKNIANDSDEYDLLYPSLIEIDIKEDGDFILENSLDNRAMCVQNCTIGEKITVDCINQIIYSSNSTHDIYDDFNYCFFRFNKTYETSVNKISFSLPCRIMFKYSLVRKVGIV